MRLTSREMMRGLAGSNPVRSSSQAGCTVRIEQSEIAERVEAQ